VTFQDLRSVGFQKAKS